MDSCHDLPEVPRSEPVFPASPAQEFPSSPPSIASDAGMRRKPKKPPPVTPRSFRRFFTPRSMLNGGNGAGSVRTNRQALKVLSSPAVNRLGPAFTRALKAVGNRTIDNHSSDLMRTPSRKRKLSFSSVGSPLQSSPLRKVRVRFPVEDGEELSLSVKDVKTGNDTQDVEPKPEMPSKLSLPIAPIRRSHALQTSGGLYMRSVLGPRANRVTMRSNVGAGWQDMTSAFYSRSTDSHSCASYTGDRLALPFCTATCNTNSLVAVGDEEGGIRLLDSAKDDKSGFSKAYLTFRPHMNAIMDLEFSSDDMLLATASGDQTAQVIDMATQKPIYCLSNHVSSVKRVQFQPAANNKVLATCSRDGNVNIWDLRCKGFERPSLQVRCSLESDSDNSSSLASKMIYPQVLNTIHGAHAWMPQTSISDKSEPQLGRSDITVTSLTFLSPGRENLFVTASEANACVRLWDLRTAHSNRRGRPVLPVSTTREPDSHIKYRRFGLTSLTLNGDGSRLYTLCRDGTVYAYSTSHLVLGHAPELSLYNDRPRRSGGSDKEGLGPLYGFRHPRLQVSSFYVKVSVRKAVADKAEMLAVGSSDHCAVLFPTDERFLHSPAQKPAVDLNSQSPGMPFTRSGLRRTNSSVGLSGRLEDTVPIYQSGTPLVEGHKKEVSAVSWSVDGELITVSDDYSARCWREGPDARDLRVGGETEGRRWKCGWADVENQYDDDDK
ncbi:WD40 repeat domain-containing protein [Aspergillus novofumigatus IBT 16806]|uniref:WD domain protein n=1 Tax=Aspergillus novofumigatus (strain IBT 16806) TaxID=1392255 RepID=A0A2I1CP95_ASPN1|nr:WD domain protein [Aspergillus novofumigatus IBT 16806]PKX99432.1 WD domain protein [Aspergillus novofumigatus IBT 16806]